MKLKLFPPLLFLLLLSFFVKAQSPQGINYQAVVRNALGQALPAGTSVSVRFQIHDGSALGPVVFQETTNATTNQFGLITHVIGSIGNLATVSWGTGTKYLQVEVDAAGGGNFTDMGTSQLMSVPYALFAGNSAGPTGATGAAGSNGLNGTNGIDGATGPQGLQGADGLNGATGTQGNTGATGAQGLPGTPGITGVTGATGAQGNTGATGSTGSNGLNGTNGIDGVTGPQGPQGADGLNGATGAQGNTGATGPQGVAGTPGVTGDAGSAGATGAMGSDGLNGSNGIDGVTGPQGPQGADGLNGATGAQGNTGATGPQGVAGTPGVTGDAGSAGATGATGSNGLDGSNGIDGVTGPQGPQGADGLNGATGAQGNTGATGPQGLPGTPGITGDAGATGATGSNGLNGSNGIDGVTGPQGPQGANGLNGATGAQGNTGATGPQGVAGTPGITGETGPAGVTGATGSNGLNGTNGLDGPTGPDGLQGPTGADGAIGLNGATGPEGATGEQGLAGVDGLNGATGDTGPQGEAGATGAQGPAGNNGLDGAPGADGSPGLAGIDGQAGSTGPTGATGSQGTTGATGSGGGATGPTGPTGATGSGGGATGPTGPTGATGIAGMLTNGNSAGNTTYWDGTQWVVDNSNIFNAGGNVGIGANNPVNKLQLGGNLHMDGHSMFFRSGAADKRDVIKWNPLTDKINIGGWSGVTLGNTSQGGNDSVSPVLTIHTDKVGIGTLTPTTAKLVIAGTPGTEGLDLSSSDQYANMRILRNSNSSINKDMYIGYLSGSNSSLHFYSNNSESVSIKNTNVGIGVIAPSQKLEVAGTTKTESLQLTGGATDGYILKSDASGNATWVNPGTVNAVTSVSNTRTANSLTTTVNGVTGAPVNVVTSNQIGFYGAAKDTIYTTVNGVASGVLSLTRFTKNIYDNDGDITSPRVVRITKNLTILADTGNFLFLPGPGNGKMGIGISTPPYMLTVGTLATFADFATVASLSYGTNRELNVTHGKLAAATGDVLEQIGIRTGYTGPDGNPLTAAMRFHKGTGITGGDLSFATASTERMRITAGGFIGINTTTPLAPIETKLAVAGDGLRLTNTTGVPGIAFNDYAGTGVSARIKSVGGAFASGDLAFEVNNGTNNINSTSTNEIMRITKTGVGIGTTNAQNLLSVNGNMDAAGVITTFITCTDANVESIYTDGYKCKFGTGANGTYGANRFNFYWNGSELLHFVDNVNVGITSDRRLKDRIYDMDTTALSRVMDLRPVNFYYKNVEGTIFTGSPVQQEGFIADELQQVIPSAVKGQKDALTKDGKIQPQTLSLTPIISVLTKAVQEQQKEIELLKFEIKELKQNQK